MNKNKTAIIIGAGPAGLTAAYELATRTDYKPVVVEANNYVGGISCTLNYKGNRIDIGGHRFFSKSDRVMSWWASFMPIQAISDRTINVHYQGKYREIASSRQAPDPDHSDLVMLVRRRKSRIYHHGQLFDYPLRLSIATIYKLGIWRTFKAGASYIYAIVFPLRNVENLEHYLINQFGRELYRSFFQSYTEKVWGVRCTQISADWGAQRIKGLSVMKAIKHAFYQMFRRSSDIQQKKTQTSLIEYFLYPKYGPGQMWQAVESKVTQEGGEIHTGARAISMQQSVDKITSVTIEVSNDETIILDADLVISTMPIKELLRALPSVPEAVLKIGNELIYRDFITVGLLVTEVKLENNKAKDNWIYIQEAHVRLGRLQIFNNWSPYLVADASTAWLGLEYFCNEGGDLWSQNDQDIKKFAIEELSSLNIIDKGDVLDAVVIRTAKAYPAYFGGYSQFNKIREYVDGIDNLYLIGRNGMHRYNNQDHSMLAAMTMVDNLVSGIRDKSNIWDLNTESEYHEEKA